MVILSLKKNHVTFYKPVSIPINVLILSDICHYYCLCNTYIQAHCLIVCVILIYKYTAQYFSKNIFIEMKKQIFGRPPFEILMHILCIFVVYWKSAECIEKYSMYPQGSDVLGSKQSGSVRLGISFRGFWLTSGFHKLIFLSKKFCLKNW